MSIPTKRVSGTTCLLSETERRLAILHEPLLWVEESHSATIMRSSLSGAQHYHYFSFFLSTFYQRHSDKPIHWLNQVKNGPYQNWTPMSLLYTIVVSSTSRLRGHIKITP